MATFKQVYGLVRVRQIRLNSGGYDRHGGYWGTRYPGQRLYEAWDDESARHCAAFNAGDREEALAIARDYFPHAIIHGAPPPVPRGEKTDVEFWSLETTDTFGGTANYSWVDRFLACVPSDNQRLRDRLLRQAAAITGVPTEKREYGETIEWKHRDRCVVTFASPLY